MHTIANSVLPNDIPTVTKGISLVAFSNKRLTREWKTMIAMMQIYCRNKHTSTTSLCAECQGLLSYAKVRLNRCRFGEAKPTCAKLSRPLLSEDPAPTNLSHDALCRTAHVMETSDYEPAPLAGWFSQGP